ncbi:MAG: hypothetical protein HQ569_09655 [Actinobacteria bacterium]|nr:hypothetical protein [Actinomycetota bacterium]
MQFKSVDRIQHFEFGYWDEVYDVWHKQGLPEYIKDEKAANEYFGFDRFELCLMNNGRLTDLNWLIPQFKELILEEYEGNLEVWLYI